MSDTANYYFESWLSLCNKYFSLEGKYLLVKHVSFCCLAVTWSTKLADPFYEATLFDCENTVESPRNTVSCKEVHSPLYFSLTNTSIGTSFPDNSVMSGGSDLDKAKACHPKAMYCRKKMNLTARKIWLALSREIRGKWWAFLRGKIFPKRLSFFLFWTGNNMPAGVREGKAMFYDFHEWYEGWRWKRNVQLWSRVVSFSIQVWKYQTNNTGYCEVLAIATFRMKDWSTCIYLCLASYM